MISLTPKQLELLQFIKKHTDETGVPPSVSEMVMATGSLRSLVARRLDALAAKRMIHRNAGQTRSIRLSAGAADITVHNKNC
jgi:SOS-response transcriptional repressor LexA